MNLEQVIQLINSQGFMQLIDRDSSKKVFSAIEEYVTQFYGKREAENREKDLIVALTSIVEMLKIPEEKKQAYFETYGKIAKKYGLPEVNYLMIKIAK